MRNSKIKRGIQAKPGQGRNTAAKARPRWAVLTVAGGLLVTYFLLAISAAATKSATFDEQFHLTSGYAYWTLGDFRMQPENGNLTQRWEALPLVFGGYKFPSLEQEAWRRSSLFDMSEQFFFEANQSAASMLLAGRIMVALLGVALGALIFLWAKRLGGTACALLSLTLYAFSPATLANGAVATSDMAASLFFMVAIGAIWKVLNTVSVKNVLLSSMLCSGLLLTKFSGPIIAPIVILLMAIQLISKRPMIVSWRNRIWSVLPRLQRLLVQTAVIAVHAIVIYVAIWAAYNFRFSMFATAGPHEPMVPWTVLQGGADAPKESNAVRDQLPQPLAERGTIVELIEFARRYRLLPEAYLYGFAHTWRFAQVRNAFFNGEYGMSGWATFFPYCFLVKTPLTFFALLGMAIATLFRAARSDRRDILYRTAPLIVLFLVYWGMAITSKLNIGHRHILVTYMPLFILAGGSTRWLFGKSRIAQAVVWGCIVLYAGEAALAWPNYLAYFNPLIGRSSNAYRHLVDSSLDWGQDLPALKAWLDRERLETVSGLKTYLSYFGTSSPEYYGIKAAVLPGFVQRPHAVEALSPGVYCISATMLQGVYNLSAPGNWCDDYERLYRDACGKYERLVTMPPQARQRLFDEEPEVIHVLLREFDGLRFGRLCAFLKNREPDAEINYSILVYRLTVTDLEQALFGSVDRPE